MEQSQQLSTQLQPERVETLTQEQFLSEVWHAFADIFGKPWYVNRGTKPSPAWVESLLELDRVKVFMAVRTYARADQRPPNLTEFLTRYKALIPVIHPPALPRPPLTEEQKAAISCHLAKSREIIKRNAYRFRFKNPDPVKPFNDEQFEALQKPKGDKNAHPAS